MDIEEIFYEFVYEDENRTVDIGDLDYFKLHPVLSYSYLVMLVLSTVLGSVGNFLIIASVLTYEKLRIKANVFVISLAVADMNVASFVQYFSIVGLIVGYDFFMERDWLCHIISVVCQVSCIASLLNMAAVAFNRYICICHNRLYHKIYTKTHLALMVIGLWMLAFFADFGPLMGWWGGHSYDAKTMLCSWNRLAEFSYTVFMVSMIVSPIGLVLFFYVSVFIKVRTSRQNIVKMGGRVAKGSAEQSGNIQLAKSLFIIFILFLCCWFPYAVLVTIDFADRYPKAAHVFTVQFAHSNSSINSVIYGMTNPTFRSGYRHVLSKCFPCLKSAQIITKQSSGSNRKSKLKNAAVFESSTGKGKYVMRSDRFLERSQSDLSERFRTVSISIISDV